MADIYVSYTRSDRDWALWIAEELKTLGHTPQVHEWEIKGGEDIAAWVTERRNAAVHVLCVMSRDYWRASSSQWEFKGTLWQAATERFGLVFFVAVKWFKLPFSLSHFPHVELVDMAEEVARSYLHGFISRYSSASTISNSVISNIPIPALPYFMENDVVLAAIETAFKRCKDSHHNAVALLHGQRGVGKTTLAAAYAKRYCRSYGVTWWIRAKEESTLRADLVALGVRLGWVGADDGEKPALAEVMERFNHQGRGILLIFDDAVSMGSLKPYLPLRKMARVLITSDVPFWREVAESVEILPWPKEIGADYLIARTGRGGEREEAEALSKELGGLPLRLEEAATVLEEINISFSKYLEANKPQEEALQPEAVRAQLAKTASPAPSLTPDGRLDAGPNSVYDVPTVDNDLRTLPIRQQVLIKTILEGLPGNAPRQMKSSLNHYDEELKARGVQPILGLLNDMFVIVEADVGASGAGREWLEEGMRKAFELFAGNHALFLQHFPLDPEREALFRRIFVDETKASGPALSKPFEDFAEAISDANKAGVATDNCLKVAGKIAEFAKVTSTLPPPPTAGPADRLAPEMQPITPKKRALLSGFGVIERFYQFVSATVTIAGTESGGKLLTKLYEILESLSKFLP